MAMSTHRPLLVLSLGLVEPVLSDFQTAITRAVQIASLPMAQLQSDQTALTAQATEHWR